MKVPMLNLPRLHAPLRQELERVFSAALDSGRFIGGEAVERFEEELARYAGTAHAVGVSSGTDALLVALMALGVGPGDEVVTTPYTFFATAGCVSRLGARPVFVDVDPETFNIDPGLIEQVLTPRTVGVIPVHLFGQCADMDPIFSLAERNKLWVVEDSAQAIGASYRGRSAGSLGTAGILSFFPAKNLGALGDGGAVLTDDEGLAQRVHSLRQHGRSGEISRYEHERVGGNFRLDALQAAFLSVKLPHLTTWQQGRRRVADRYRELLGCVPSLALPREVEGCTHVFNQYVIQFKKRDRIREALGAGGVASAIYYPKPLHLQKCFEALSYKSGDFTNSERLARESLAIPVDPLLTEEEISLVVDCIKGAIE